MEVKIIPTGGLCNRLRAIATGVAVAKRYHCPSIIYWNNSLGLKADYCELFKPIPQEDVKLVENKQWLYNINGNKDYLVRWPLLKTMFEQTVFNFSIYRDGDEVYSKLKKAIHELSFSSHAIRCVRNIPSRGCSFHKMASCKE